MTRPTRFYLTGTDTDVGKTVTAAVLCRELGLDYFKPVQAGTSPSTDSETVRRLAPEVKVWREAVVLQRPASPHASAHDEGRVLRPEDVVLPAAEKLLVEGAGGWMVPYGDDPLWWQSDLVKHLGLPVVLVTRTGLGTLNHTMVTLRAMKADGVEVAGIVFVGDEHPENERDLARWGGVPVWGRVPRNGAVNGPEDVPGMVWRDPRI